MLIGVAGLEEGVITPRSIIVDQGRYTRYTTVNPPACWIWNQRKGTHGAVDIVSGLRDSCNYYFYEVGNRLGIDRIEAYARQFGFGVPTGIELPGEVGGIVAGKEHTEGVIRSIVRQRIAGMAGNAYREASIEERQAYDEAAVRFIENNSIGFIQTELESIGIVVDRETIDRQIYSYIRDTRWNPARTLSASIGQAENTYSPLQMASYMATLANGGTRYRVHLLDRVVSQEGLTVEKTLPEILGNVEMDPKNYQAIMLGMRAVTSDIYQSAPGTAARTFREFKTPVGGKTGSAQFPGRDAYGWFLAFAPYDNPEIAVAVMIAQAGSGGSTAPVAQAIFAEYFGQNTQENTFDGRNRLIP